MEHCDCSLADVLLCNNHRMDMCECNKHRKKSCGMFKEEDTIGQEYRDALIFFLKTIEDIVNGLDFLHYDGFVHRDLNLSNILVSIFYLGIFIKQKIRCDIFKTVYFRKSLLAD